jgi:hypothetical protein
MTSTETTCLSCGTSIRVDDRKAKTGRILSRVMLVLFWLAAASGVAGLFMTNGPPAKPSFLVAGLLLLLKSSAREMVRSDS